MTGTVRIGTRGSALALAQARLVREALTAVGAAAEEVTIETAGDRRVPDTAWGEGAFVAAIAEAVLAGRVDIAVHSAKDVPTDEDPRLRVAAYLPRADARDALVVAAGAVPRTLATLPAGARVGTDSPRRAGFVLAVRPDLVVVPLHGNVDTRFRRLDGGEADALVLAVASLERLGRADRITQRLPPELCPPAPGQGAVAVQVRVADAVVAGLVALLDDAPTRSAVELERSFLRAMGGGCRSPIGALSGIHDGKLSLLGGVADASGETADVQRVEGPTSAAAGLVATLAARLRRPRRLRRWVLVTRAGEGADRLATALSVRGISARSVPAIRTAPLAPGGPLDEALQTPDAWDWLVVTSAAGAASVLDALARVGGDPVAWRWAAVGPTTAAVIGASGVTGV